MVAWSMTPSYPKGQTRESNRLREHYRKQLEMPHVFNNNRWLLDSLLRGCTVGYPSDSLTSCFMIEPNPQSNDETHRGRNFFSILYFRSLTVLDKWPKIDQFKISSCRCSCLNLLKAFPNVRESYRNCDVNEACFSRVCMCRSYLSKACRLTLLSTCHTCFVLYIDYSQQIFFIENTL